MLLFCIALTDSEGYRGQLSGLVAVWTLIWMTIHLSHMNMRMSFPPCLMTLSGPQWNLDQFHRTADHITDLCLLCQGHLVTFDPSNDVCRIRQWAVITGTSSHPSLPNASCMAAVGGETHCHFGKGTADVGRLGKSPQWSEGVQEEQQVRAVLCGGTLPLNSVSWSPLALDNVGRDKQPAV